MIEDIKISLVFATLLASLMHVVAYYATGGIHMPFAADVGFLACAFVPTLVAIRRMW